MCVLLMQGVSSILPFICCIKCTIREVFWRPAPQSCSLPMGAKNLLALEPKQTGEENEEERRDCEGSMALLEVEYARSRELHVVEPCFS